MAANDGSRSLRKHAGQGLSRRSADLAQRTLSDLVPDSGCTVVLTRGPCPHARTLEQALPQPVFYAAEPDEVLARLTSREVALVVVGADRDGAIRADLAVAIRNRIPCLTLRPGRWSAPVTIHDGHGIFHLAWPQNAPVPPSTPDLLPRLERLRVLFQHQGRVSPDEKDPRQGRALAVYSGYGWDDALDYCESVTYEATTDLELERHIAERPDLDLILIGGCFFKSMATLEAGFQVAEARGIPVLVPSECRVTPFAWSTLPAVHAEWIDTIDGANPSMLWIGVPAALQERKAWLHAQGRPYDHLPDMPS